MFICVQNNLLFSSTGLAFDKSLFKYNHELHAYTDDCLMVLALPLIRLYFVKCIVSKVKPSLRQIYLTETFNLLRSLEICSPYRTFFLILFQFVDGNLANVASKKLYFVCRKVQWLH